VLKALKQNKYIVKVPEEIRIKAKEAVDRMFNLLK
jgi:quinolinate synthase